MELEPQAALNYKMIPAPGGHGLPPLICEVILQISDSLLQLILAYVYEQHRKRAPVMTPFFFLEIILGLILVRIVQIRERITNECDRSASGDDIQFDNLKRSQATKAPESTNQYKPQGTGVSQLRPASGIQSRFKSIQLLFDELRLQRMKVTKLREAYHVASKRKSTCLRKIIDTCRTNLNKLDDQFALDEAMKEAMDQFALYEATKEAMEDSWAEYLLQAAIVDKIQEDLDAALYCEVIIILQPAESAVANEPPKLYELDRNPCIQYELYSKPMVVYCGRRRPLSEIDVYLTEWIDPDDQRKRNHWLKRRASILAFFSQEFPLFQRDESISSHVHDCLPIFMKARLLSKIDVYLVEWLNPD
ncbi:hypothetical protein BX600DRAFT_517705 [Xylariales sp. PMI_506]|nr:hypothetical protein BX600DRAFT_517705 [Xylariales sp. PMI_506]